MKTGIHQFMASTMLMAAGLAHAAVVVIPAGGTYNGARLSGIATLSFSADMLGTFDTMAAAVTSYGAGSATALKDSNGYYTQVSMAAPLASVTVDASANSGITLASTGGLTLTVPTRKNVSTGGALTITDLDIDLVNKLVYATLVGANGVGTLNHMALWNFYSLATGAPQIGFDSSCGFYNDCQYTAPNITLGGLSLTNEGKSATGQALGLLTLGTSAFTLLADDGSIFIGVVPEPSSYALMALGLIGILTATRRRKLRPHLA